MQTEPFVMECIYNAPVSAVWLALTDKKKMKKWYFDLKEFTPEVGFVFTFYGGNENQTFLHRCEIVEVIPNKKLAHTWEYPGYEGSSIVSFELFTEGDQTRVKLTHSGLETFPADHPSFVRTNFEQGWAYILGTSLKNYLEK